MGKKSWNVYNQDNIAKVKRDEALAKAKEEAEEQHMQEVDAERRMQILRGQVPTPILEIEDRKDDSGRKRSYDGPPRERKRRKLAGEDQTDFEMRIAQETSLALRAETRIVLRNPMDAPLLDHSGHIDLFLQDYSRKVVEKNEEVEKEKAKKKKELENQTKMRFSDAAGYKRDLENPWYSKAGTESLAVEDEAAGKDVWGNEDPRRKEREAARISMNDPLAFMRQGAAKVRQVEKERKSWREEKEREVKEFKDEERRKRKRKRDDDDEDDNLDGFSMDKPKRITRSSRHRDDRDHERGHRHRQKERRKSERERGDSTRSRHRGRSEGEESFRHSH